MISQDYIEAALKRYGGHLSDCALVGSVRADNTPRRACNCGWAAVAAALHAGKEAA